MDISEVVKASGLPASTLRFYEESGLIHSSGRNGLRRLFNPNVIERLALISLGRTAGFSLAEISTMFTLNGPLIDRELLLKKAGELNLQIKKLESMRDGLIHAAECKAPNHFECEKFLRLLNIASGRKQKKGPPVLSNS
ncbi:MAG TPA: helix-turn-helix domain-containing protein [Methylophilaceae bacterium]|nr:helix-turn-helix domain-containing protein [Methylophilaceae bacterium]